MLNIYAAHIEHLSLHRVGNNSRNEQVFLSQDPYTLNDEISALLKEYFFRPFREKEENYFKFSHEADLEFNEVYQLANALFDQPNTTHEISKKITSYLFEQLAEHSFKKTYLASSTKTLPKDDFLPSGMRRILLCSCLFWRRSKVGEIN